MSLLEKNLVVKRSTIPGSGKGLFTKKPIPKGTAIIEYKGKITDWENANHDDGNNPYIFYVNRNYVIDALNRLTSLARYANDVFGRFYIYSFITRNICTVICNAFYPF